MELMAYLLERGQQQQKEQTNKDKIMRKLYRPTRVGTGMAYRNMHNAHWQAVYSNIHVGQPGNTVLAVPDGAILNDSHPRQSISTALQLAQKQWHTLVCHEFCRQMNPSATRIVT